jgi:uridylate kinase
MAPGAIKYKRILLKLSGEVMGGKDGKGMDFKVMRNVAAMVKTLVASKVQVAVVIGGGNFWRYRDFKHSRLERVNSDYLGMLATIINSVAFQDELRAAKVKAKAVSSFAVKGLVHEFNTEEARGLLEKGSVVICAGGTGNPFCTTDMAAALRAGELKCDLLVKATNVNYAYDKDPDKYKDAKPLKKLTHDDVLARRLGVMDLAAIATARVAKVPIAIFNMTRPKDLLEILRGKSIGTIIK